ncbi:PilN domain-containing protein [Desulfurobacterium sp.]|uniref:PilN domain-containing protein n=1 Tax=Desulfurobacterium sp. TaxID=2004706 RepID=UPI00260D24A5|nr:PilN domain-containing protein [Desulfurobacterium sp.]
MLRFNFLEKKETFVEKILKPDIILAVLLALALTGGLSWYTGQLKLEELSLRKENARLDKELVRLRKIQREEKLLIKKRQVLKKKLQVISELDKKREVPRYIYFFAARNNVPYGVWLIGLRQSGNSLFIEGGAYNLKLVSKFLKNVEQNLGTVKFKQTSYEEYKSKESNKTYHYYKFQFTVEMK